MIDYAKGVFMYKYTNNIHPNSFHGQWLTGMQMHPLSELYMVNKPIFRYDYPSLDFVKKLPLVSLPVLWNNLTCETTLYEDSPSVESFKGQLRKKLIDDLSPNVACTRPLLCAECITNNANRSLNHAPN